MASPIPYPVDDKDLDDAALWAVIDSAAASHSTSKSRKTLALKYTNHQTPNPSPPPRFSKSPRNHHSGEKDFRFSPQGEVLHEPWIHHRPQKIARTCISELSETSPLSVVKHVQRTPKTPAYSSSSSPETGMFSVTEFSPGSEMNCWQVEDKEKVRHSLLGKFPSVSLFKEYQNAAMAVLKVQQIERRGRSPTKLCRYFIQIVFNAHAQKPLCKHLPSKDITLQILEKTDYTTISGNPFIKKSGWRKISCYFNLSYEIKDKTIEFDENRNVQRAEFVVRAYMQGGRFSDGWGSCERREKRFLKPNHDIPSTAETRAKNKACQDLLGIGEYRPGGNPGQR